MGKATVKKTKVGSEYRVRDGDGKIRGEFNSPAKAVKRAVKTAVRRKKK